MGVSDRSSASPSYEASSYVCNYAYSGQVITCIIISIAIQIGMLNTMGEEIITMTRHVEFSQIKN